MRDRIRLIESGCAQRIANAETTLFDTLKPRGADAILKLISEHQNDPRPVKVDLGVGVYRDAAGETPILHTVKKAERWLLENQDSKAYLGSRGAVDYCAAIQNLTFGVTANERIETVQTPGGSGGLRVAASLILGANPNARLWVSEPTWANHTPLLGGAGIRLESYPYYDSERRAIRFSDMLDRLLQAQAGDLVLLHGCCHNPTGMDLSRDQWDQTANLIVERGLIPFIDLAYQGFAVDLDTDAEPVRNLVDRVPEMLVTTSCSKNFGLYRDRVGALSIIAADAETARTVCSQTLYDVRTMYSVPPDHGAAVVARILLDEELRAEWEAELAAMRERIKDMRTLLVETLADTAGDSNFSHIQRGNGMFSYLGVSAEQVGRLKKDFGIYLTDSSRINVCGITPGNVRYLAKSVAAVL